MNAGFIIQVIFLIVIALQGIEVAAAPIVINQDTGFSNLTPYIEFIEDAEGKRTIDEVSRDLTAWKPMEGDSINFGFRKSTFWFKFTVENRLEGKGIAYFEINYPMLDQVEFYKPEGDGFKAVKTGDRFPFSQREVDDRNFLFTLSSDAQPRTYYLHIVTDSSLNFVPAVLTHQHYIKRANIEFPLYWGYFGGMLFIAIYYLFLFLSLRSLNFLLFVTMIVAYTMLQFNLNGMSFQYLWPDSTWWSNHSTPFLTALTPVPVGLFTRSYLETAKNFKKLNILILAGAIVPGAVWSIVTLLIDYGVGIRVATLLTLIGTLTVFFCYIAAALYRSRDAMFGLLAMSGMVGGSLLFIFKSFGLLPMNLFTHTGPLSGSAIMALLFSFGLADKFNSLQTSLVRLNVQLESGERKAKDRTLFLEGVVASVRSISEAFSQLGSELLEISKGLGRMYHDQMESSERLRSIFSGLASSNESIYKDVVTQKKEGGNVKNLVTDLNSEQQRIMAEGQRVSLAVASVYESAGETEKSLNDMFERISLITSGGKEITQFIAIINDISDRINLLSLNAAIEAARAGEQGRGFAVVADEIGKLAAATAENSKLIAQQVSRIIRDIEGGSAIVSSTRVSTGRIFSMVNDIREGIDSVGSLLQKQVAALEVVLQQTGFADTLSESIAAATEKHNRSMEDTFKTVEGLLKMAQEVSASNQRITESISTINEKADELLSLIENTG